jgi:hypothetical protein
MKERQCKRCNEFWPNDEEFYKPNALTCLACQYEVRKGHKQRRKEREATLPIDEQKKRLEARRKADRERERRRRMARSSMV